MMIEPPLASSRFRNTEFVIRHTRRYFDEAYAQHLMGLYGRSIVGRQVELEPRPKVLPRRLTDFVRCSYLGLDNHPAIVAGAVAAIRAYRSVHWSCARTRLNFSLLAELETTLSDLFRCRVVAFSTVLAANMGALPLLASGHLTDGRRPVVVFDRLCHASLAYHKPVVATETRVITIPHNDLNALEDICRREARVAYVLDGVYSMGGSAPIRELIDLQNRYDLFLYVDDAHGVSIFGRNGEGFARSQFPDDLGGSTMIAASLGKGFGASGGILMLGTFAQEEIVRRYALPYVFSASPNLAAVGAALASAKLHVTPELGARQAALAERIRSFDRQVATRDSGQPLPIRMVPIGDEREAIARARLLLDQGVYTSVTFFPTVARGNAGIRVCLTASHTLDELDRLCGLLNTMR